MSPEYRHQLNFYLCGGWLVCKPTGYLLASIVTLLSAVRRPKPIDALAGDVPSLVSIAASVVQHISPVILGSQASGNCPKAHSAVTFSGQTQLVFLSP